MANLMNGPGSVVLDNKSLRQYELDVTWDHPVKQQQKLRKEYVFARLLYKINFSAEMTTFVHVSQSHVCVCVCV